MPYHSEIPPLPTLKPSPSTLEQYQHSRSAASFGQHYGFARAEMNTPAGISTSYNSSTAASHPSSAFAGSHGSIPVAHASSSLAAQQYPSDYSSKGSSLNIKISMKYIAFILI